MNTPQSKRVQVLVHPSQTLSVLMLRQTLARAGPKKYCNLWGVSQGPGAPPGLHSG